MGLLWNLCPATAEERDASETAYEPRSTSLMSFHSLPSNSIM